jgi:tetratricopeptide (TPR) repeat protein
MLMWNMQEYVEAYSFRALEEFSQKRFPQALRTLAKALSLEPSSDLALLLRGDVWMATRHPRLAIRDLDALLRRHPDCIAAYLRRAEARLSMGHWQAAVRNCSQALDRDPRNTAALQLRAIVQVDKRRLPKALNDLDRLLGIEPDNFEARIDRGYVRFMLGDFNGSRGDLSRAVEMPGAAGPSLRSATRLLKHIRRMQELDLPQTG